MLDVSDWDSMRRGLRLDHGYGYCMLSAPTIDWAFTIAYSCLGIGGLLFVETVLPWLWFVEMLPQLYLKPRALKYSTVF